MNELNTELARLQEQVAFLRRDLRSHAHGSEFVRESCTTVADLVMENADLKRQLAELQKERNELAAQIEEWGSEKEAACQRAEFAEDQLEVALKDRTHAEGQLSEAREEIDRLTWQVEEWRKANLPVTAKCSDLEQALAIKREHIAWLQRDERMYRERALAAESKLGTMREALRSALDDPPIQNAG